MGTDRLTATKTSKVPIVRVEDQNLQRFIDAVTDTINVREGNKGQDLDKNVTWRDLVGSDIAVQGYRKNTFGPSPIINPPDPAPPDITNFTATGGYASVTLTWDGMSTRYSHVEIWRSATDDLSTAALVGTAPYPDAFYIDFIPNSINQTYYYWARTVSLKGVYGSWTGDSGISATTKATPDYYLDLLARDAANSALWDTLTGKIASDGGVSDALTVLDGNVDNLTASVGDNAAAIQVASLILSGDGVIKNISSMVMFGGYCHITLTSAHGYSVGDNVYLNGIVGPDELSGKTFNIVSIPANNTFDIDVDISGYSAYVSGGTCKRVGLSAMYYVKADVNGYVSGYGLYNDGSFSRFLVNADEFAVGKGDGTVDDFEFVVLTTATTFNAGTPEEYTLQPGVYIHSANIQNLDASQIRTGLLTITSNMGIFVGAGGDITFDFYAANPSQLKWKGASSPTDDVIMERALLGTTRYIMWYPYTDGQGNLVIGGLYCDDRSFNILQVAATYPYFFAASGNAYRGFMIDYANAALASSVTTGNHMSLGHSATYDWHKLWCKYVAASIQLYSPSIITDEITLSGWTIQQLPSGDIKIVDAYDNWIAYGNAEFWIKGTFAVSDGYWITQEASKQTTWRRQLMIKDQSGNNYYIDCYRN